MESIITNFIIGFVILTVLLIIFVIWKSRKGGYSTSDTKFMTEKWQQISASAKHDPRHAIMDADKLLDHALKKKGYEGTLGEKMKTARSLFSDNSGIWEAHKTRNKIAHELDFQINQSQCNHHLSHFRRALRDLGLKI